MIITDSGLLKDKIIDIPQNMKSKFFAQANDMLVSMFAGRTVKEITDNGNIIVESTIFPIMNPLNIP